MSKPGLSFHLSSPSTTSAPRVRRGDAAVLAQYIQDITHQRDPQVHAAAA